jgi:hypothetical protein
MSCGEPSVHGDLADRFLALELKLMDPVFRKDRGKVATLMTEDFREFGASGRYWRRQTILDTMVMEVGYLPPKLEDFAIQRIGTEAVLVTYRAVREATATVARRETLRSSLWILSESGWKIAFHQGTLIGSVVPEA